MIERIGIIIAIPLAFYIVFKIFNYLDDCIIAKEKETVAHYVFNELPQDSFVINGTIYKMRNSKIVHTTDRLHGETLLCRTQRGSWFLLHITTSHKGIMFPRGFKACIEKESFTDKEALTYLSNNDNPTLAEKYFGQMKEA